MRKSSSTIDPDELEENGADFISNSANRTTPYPAKHEKSAVASLKESFFAELTLVILP
jgi:hypothetical protein